MWLQVAQIINELRIVPRIILLGFAVFTVWYVDYLTRWYMALPADERNLEATGLLSITIPAVTGLFGVYCKHYMEWRPGSGGGG